MVHLPVGRIYKPTAPCWTGDFLKGSDDGFNWLDVDASLMVETDAIVTTPRYLSAHNTAVIISYGFVRVRFVITAEAATTATTLLSAAVRVYRAT